MLSNNCWEILFHFSSNKPHLFFSLSLSRKEKKGISPKLQVWITFPCITHPRSFILLISFIPHPRIHLTLFSFLYIPLTAAEEESSVKTINQPAVLHVNRRSLTPWQKGSSGLRKSIILIHSLYIIYITQLFALSFSE